MRTNLIIAGLLAFLYCSCSSPSYLPSSDKIDVNQYGSYIMVNPTLSSNVNGELIAIDSNKLVILTESKEDHTKKTVIVLMQDVKHFTLRYAQSKHYWGTIPVYMAATASHGLFAVFSAPVNLLVTISVTAAGEKAFTYSEAEMTFDKLKLFARFPQGIPPNVDIASIK